MGIPLLLADFFLNVCKHVAEAIYRISYIFFNFQKSTASQQLLK